MRDMAKLIAAFADLNDEGIITLHNHLCCGNCAATDIGVCYGKFSPEEKARWMGAVYYHEQAAEDAVEGGDLALGYGSLSVGSSEAIGEKLVEALRARKLNVEWDGDPRKKVFVTGFQVSKYEIPPGVRRIHHDKEN